jgi:hypothetical protein
MLLCAPYAEGQNDSAVTQIIYTPHISGLIKTKWEYCFDDNTGRFDVRNARLKIGGILNRIVDYGMQMDYSAHGKFSFLDGYLRLKPCSNLTLWIGQFIVRFSENYVISQYQNVFSNRSFVAKFINPDARDIGMQLDYRITNLPLTVHLGLYNGSGINNPQWQKSPFALIRLVYGTMDGFRVGVKYHGGKTALDDRIANYGFDLRYSGESYTLETEYVVKDSVYTDVYLSSGYIQGTYILPVKGNLARYLTPTVRVDGMGYGVFDNGFDVCRATAGFNIGLAVNRMDAEIRFNYEYFMKENESGLKENPYYDAYFERTDKALFNKFTLEFLIKF